MLRWQNLRRVNRAICIGIVEIAAFGVVVSMFIESMDSMGSKILGMPLPGAHEFTIAFLVLIIFGGMPYAELTKSHIRITLIYDRVSSKRKIVLNLISDLVGFLFLSVLTWQNSLFAKTSFEIREYAQGLFRFPVYPLKIVLTIGLAWMSVQLLIGIVENFVRLTRPGHEGVE